MRDRLTLHTLTQVNTIKFISLKIHIRYQKYIFYIFHLVIQ